jgi:hypothetical protein
MLPHKNQNTQPEGPMNNTDTSHDHRAALLEADFGGRWGIWLSDTGHWWATRREPLNASALSAGCVPFLRAGHPDELTGQIREQEELHLPA